MYLCSWDSNNAVHGHVNMPILDIIDWSSLQKYLKILVWIKNNIWPYYVWAVEMIFNTDLTVGFFFAFWWAIWKSNRKYLVCITSHIASSILPTVVLYSILFQVRRRWAAEPSRNWDKTYPTTHKGDITVASFVWYCPNIMRSFFPMGLFLEFLQRVTTAHERHDKYNRWGPIYIHDCQPYPVNCHLWTEIIKR